MTVQFIANHYHLAPHIDEQSALEWEEIEVAWRWTHLFTRPVLVRTFVAGHELSPDQRQVGSLGSPKRALPRPKDFHAVVANQSDATGTGEKVPLSGQVSRDPRFPQDLSAHLHRDVANHPGHNGIAADASGDS